MKNDEMATTAAAPPQEEPTRSPKMATVEGHTANPFTDPCFTDVTEEFLGKSIAIVGAPPPDKPRK